MVHLQIYTEDFVRPSIDIDMEFDKISIEKTPSVEKFLKILDNAIYKSPSQFIDCFNTTLDIDCLSTGCKTALLALFRPDLLIDLTECGDNARSAILNFITEGNIISPPFLLPIIYPFSEPTCDVELNSYRFTKFKALSNYLYDEYPGLLPLLPEGVEELIPHDLSRFKDIWNNTWFPPLGSHVK